MSHDETLGGGQGSRPDPVPATPPPWARHAAAVVRRLETIVGPLDGSGVGVERMPVRTPAALVEAAESVLMGVPWRAGRAHQWWREALAPAKLAWRHINGALQRFWRAYFITLAPVVLVGVLLWAGRPVPDGLTPVALNLAVGVGVVLALAASSFPLPSRLVRAAASFADIAAVRELIVRSGWSPLEVRTALDLQDHYAAGPRRRMAAGRWAVATLWALGVYGLGKCVEALLAPVTGLLAPPGAATFGIALVGAVYLPLVALLYAIIESHGDEIERVFAAMRAALAAVAREQDEARPS